MSFTHKEIAHRWAHNENPAKDFTGSRIFTKGDSIYSHGYHYTAARKIRDKRGSVVLVLLNSTGRSRSTSAHNELIQQAVSHLPTMYCCNPDARSKAGHRDNYNAMITERNGLIHTSKTQRQGSQANQTTFREIMQLTSRANGYTKYFKLGFRLLNHFERTEDQQASHDKAIDAHMARAEAAQAKRAKQWAKEIKEAEPRINDWLAGTRSQFPAAGVPMGEVLLRVSPDGKQIDTSLGANVPIVFAPRLWSLVKHCKETRTLWTRNETLVRLGHYKLDSIDAHGNIQAGCHYIKFEQLEKIAIQLGLTKPMYTVMRYAVSLGGN